MHRSDKSDVFELVWAKVKAHPLTRNMDLEASKRLARDILDGKRELPPVPELPA